MTSGFGYRCWAEIDQAALRENARFVRESVGSGVEMLAVVKANGYGHGLVHVAKALAEEAQLFGVANLEEAVTLSAEVSQPIVILGPALDSERAMIAAGGFIPSVSSFEEAQGFNGSAKDRPVFINFVIDTGMGRMGVVQSKAHALFRKIQELPNIRTHSLSTHLPVSNEDPDFTRIEIAQFATLVETFRKDFPGNYKVHVLPSSGVLAYGEAAFEIVRAGLVLYGIPPMAGWERQLRPAMTWKARVVLVRDMPAGHGISYGRTFVTPRPMRVATLSAGYADGYPRHLSNSGTAVLVHGKRCSLLGRITMDLMMIDVSEVDAKPGDEVVLMGRQGEESISAVELAERTGTISWEIVTRIGSRVPRVYV